MRCQLPAIGGRKRSSSKPLISIMPTSRRSSCGTMRTIVASMTNWPLRRRQMHREIPTARRSPGAGGWCFPFDPYVPASQSPALWRPEIAPGIVALHPAPSGYPSVAPIEPSDLGSVLADHEDASGRHLVIDDPGGRLRLWLAGRPPCSGLIIIVAPDSYYPLRRAVADRVARRLRGTSAGRLPSDVQLRRLTIMLHLLQLLSAGLSTREMADKAVYPGLKLRGSGWRAANERREVQRLRDEALRLMEGGYLDLLRGRSPGARCDIS